MNGSSNPYAILGRLEPIGRLIAPFVASHFNTVVIVLAFGMIVTSGFFVNYILFQTPEDMIYRVTKEEEIISTTFDRNTIEKIERLNQRDDAINNVSLPADDINPFQ